MPYLRQRSGGGDAEHFLADYEFEALEKALGVSFNPETRERLQTALNLALSWGFEFDADAAPILAHYDALAKQLSKVKRLLDQGPKTNDHDSLFFAKYAYDANRNYKFLRLDWERLPFIIGQISQDIVRARKALIDRHTTPKPRNRTAAPGLDRLVHIMAEFSEGVGVNPNADYNDAEREPGDERKSPFVAFIDYIRKTIGDKLPESRASTISIVRRVIAKRRKRRAVSSIGDPLPDLNLNPPERPLDPREEARFFASVFDEAKPKTKRRRKQ